MALGKLAFINFSIALTAMSVVAHAQTAPAAPAEDPLFKVPFVDKDEWRDTPVRHRYVHGGFKDTNLRFSFYFPEKKQYQGRFFQYVTPVPDSENLTQTPGDEKIGMALEAGAYFIETNSGGVGATAGPAFGVDPTIAAFRANAASAAYSRKVAAEMYGRHRTFGYLYGGSGGGYRTLGSMENTNGVWDGAVPFILGSPMAAPNGFSIRMHAMRILKDKFPQIVDAMDAGGSGDPYAGLNEEEAAALREASGMGFPLRSWFGYKTMGVHAFTALYQGMVMADPGYFDDFWTKPGYLGFDHPESFAKHRLQFPTKVNLILSEEHATAKGIADLRLPGAARGSADQAWQRVVKDGTARPVAVQVEGTPPDVSFIGGDLFILSGEAKGKRLALRALKDNIATFGVVDAATLAKLKPGDEVRLDNSNFLAAQTYHRHQVPDARYKVYDQFRKADGTPLYPQRKTLLGPMFALGAAGTVPTGHFNGKIIVVGSMLDREAYIWQSDWYRQRFDEHYGKDAKNRYRLWINDNALHGASEDKDAPTRVINYMGVLHQALRDVSAWVEKGTPPPANTSYRVEDGQMRLAETAKERGGIQPVIKLTRVRVSANSEDVIEEGNGRYYFSAMIEAPRGTGKIVSAAWDFDGSGKFAEKAILPKRTSAKVRISTVHIFRDPGTHFVTLKVESRRDGNAASPYARIPNLARVRVIVE